MNPMKHVLIGGDGFVGRHLAADLHSIGEEVLVADIQQGAHDIYRHVPFLKLDVTKPEQLRAIDLKPDDIVYNLSARMLSPIMPRRKRRAFFWPVNYDGVENILQFMEEKGCTRLIHYTTDMIYGHSKSVPQTENHAIEPLGEYGRSKLETEHLCRRYRKKGMQITIFRPRLIVGPGRLGILSKLFKLIDANLPVPMIGKGRNPYQFISVFDCSRAAICAWQAGIPNSEYNLGSDNPPSIRELLGRLIKETGSRSILLPTPAPLVKATLTMLDLVSLPLMDPEQYLIADEVCILDCSKAKREIGWQPRYRDDDMLLAAYRGYRKGRNTARVANPATAPAE